VAVFAGALHVREKQKASQRALAGRGTSAYLPGAALPSLGDHRHMADFTKEWIEHLKQQISGRMNLVADKMDPQAYDQLVTDLAWFTFRFARDPDTKMRKVFR
jgi:hypothetical protein